MKCPECGSKTEIKIYICDRSGAEQVNTEDALKAEIKLLKAFLNDIVTIGDCTEKISDVIARRMMRKIAFDAANVGTMEESK
jgi:hypothetical protein